MTKNQIKRAETWKLKNRLSDITAIRPLPMTHETEEQDIERELFDREMITRNSQLPFGWTPRKNDGGIC